MQQFAVRLVLPIGAGKSCCKLRRSLVITIRLPRHTSVLLSKAQGLDRGERTDHDEFEHVIDRVLVEQPSIHGFRFGGMSGMPSLRNGIGAVSMASNDVHPKSVASSRQVFTDEWL